VLGGREWKWRSGVGLRRLGIGRGSWGLIFGLGVGCLEVRNNNRRSGYIFRGFGIGGGGRERVLGGGEWKRCSGVDLKGLGIGSGSWEVIF
jgi:hypothetical protein